MILTGVFASIFLQLLYLSYLDIRYKIIPNKWSIFNIIVFIALLIFLPQEYPFNFSLIAYALIFLLSGFGLFLLNIMGAGDIKFLATFFLIVPPIWHERMFLLLLYSTLIIGSLVLIYNLGKNHKDLYYFFSTGDHRVFKKILGSKFSFVPVIFFAWTWLGLQIKIYQL